MANAFQAWYDLDSERKVLSVHDETLELYSDLNTVSRGGHLTLYLLGKLNDHDFKKVLVSLIRPFMNF